MNTVKLSDNHLKLINRALETYYRLKSGQIGMAVDTVFADRFLSWEHREEIEKAVRRHTHPNLPSGAAHSFNSEHIGDASIAYEIKKTFEEFLAVQRNGGFYGSTVDFHGPLKASNEPLPEIVGFNRSKDYKLNKRQSKKVIAFKNKNQYNDMWNYIVSLREKLDFPKGEKSEIIINEDIVTIRIFKPYRNEPSFSA